MIPDLLDTLPDRVKGFLDREEGLRLYETAKEAGRLNACLEIGSYCGKSTIYLGLGCKESGGVLYAVDHHRGSEEQQPGEEYFDPDLADTSTGGIGHLSLVPQNPGRRRPGVNGGPHCLPFRGGGPALGDAAGNGVHRRGAQL